MTNSFNPWRTEPQQTADTNSIERAPILVTEDLALVDVVGRMAAANGAEVRVVAPEQLRVVWPVAAIVFVGADAWAESTHAVRDLPRRDKVIAVTVTADPELDVRPLIGLGVERIVELPADERWLADVLADLSDGGGKGGRVIGVVGGRGGAGASTFAASLGLAAVDSGFSAVIVDADIRGGGLDITLGIEKEKGLRWNDFSLTSGRLPISALVDNLPRVRGLSVVSHGHGGHIGVHQPQAAPSDEAMRSVIDCARRSCDVVVVDLPRDCDTQMVPLSLCSDVIVVVPSDIRSVSSSAEVIARLRERIGSVHVVGHVNPSRALSADDVAEALGMPMSAVFHEESAISAAADRGDPPGHRTSMSKAAVLVINEIAGA